MEEVALIQLRFRLVEVSFDHFELAAWGLQLFLLHFLQS